MEAHLLASVVDAVNANTWVTQAMHVKRPGKPPKPVPRPGVAQPAGAGVPDLPGIPVHDWTGGVPDGDNR